ncbi:MAG: membrane protein insertion efficiency factor YidD [Firmicutes bacterium]|nr:membrane protein insertion efficiency factor YidD [Bacillota bacterium]
MKKLMIYCIMLYRKYVSPFKRSSCRFHPTCSRYAMDAIEKYGCLKGGYLAIKRILKCHPFNHGGYDPIK